MLELVQQPVSSYALQPLHQTAHCNLGRDRHEKVYVISRNVTLHYQNLVLATDFSDKLPQPQSYRACQKWFTVLCNPHEMKMDRKYRVRAPTILAHYIDTLPQGARHAEAFA